jgi:2-polyprenyl-3-methyl-5-hydroxy-6-metoxy-1,4-benzoquinol methylase
MSLFINTKYRSNKTELMDDFSSSGAVLRDTLDKIAIINKWLGGNHVTINGLKKLLNSHPKEKPLTIVDLGCGGGDLLRDVAEFGIRNGYSFKVIGVDANEDAVNYARELSMDYPEISFVHCNIHSHEFQSIEYDVVLTSLFLHHFNTEELEELLSNVLSKVSVGILVNDLHRHPFAYYLFRLLCLVISNRMVREDGLTSILKGFKRHELERISVRLGVKYEIKWKWAFRYQWIIQNR